MESFAAHECGRDCGESSEFRLQRLDPVEVLVPNSRYHPERGLLPFFLLQAAVDLGSLGRNLRARGKRPADISASIQTCAAGIEASHRTSGYQPAGKQGSLRPSGEGCSSWVGKAGDP